MPIDLHEKGSAEYLDASITGNGAEKSQLASMAIQRLVERGENPASILEIGPGSGSAIIELASMIRDRHPDLVGATNLSLVELDTVESEKLKKAREEFEEIGPTTLIRGDAKRLDQLLEGESMDIITASAVVHEIFSYGGGYPAVNDTVGAISNVLRPGGFFAYRDVYSVEDDSQHNRAKHIYDNEGWVRFIKIFVPYYLARAEHPYKREDDMLVFEQDSSFVTADEIDPQKYLGIEGPIGILREIQRHYITLRDYLWREGSLGVSPILEGNYANDWMDHKKGHKRVHYTTELDDPLLEAMSEEAGAGHSVVDGDIFDDTTDVLLANFLEKAQDDPSSDEAKIFQRWMDREGSETYVYYTRDRLLGAVAMSSLRATDGKKVLLPTQITDVFASPRLYYNRYMRRQLSSPLYDGKQMALFEAVDVRRRPDCVSRGLGVLATLCSKDTISKIYAPLSKLT